MNKQEKKLIKLQTKAQECVSRDKAVKTRKQEEWKDILDTWIDDPQSAANHMVLGMDLKQRREARGKVGKKTVPTWV